MIAKEYRTVRQITGPLMLVGGVEGVTYGELADIIKRIGNPTTFWDVIRGLDPKKPYQPPAHATGPIAGLMNEEQIRAIVREEMLKAQGEHEEVKAAEEQGLPWDE